MQPRITPRHLHAFTLIELLTVIAIIGILAAILIPTVGRVRANAQSARALSEKRQIGLALSLYAQDNRQHYPPVAVSVGGSPRPWMRTPLMPYLPPARVNSQGEATSEHPIFNAPGSRAKSGSSVAVRRAYSGGGALYILPASANPATNSGLAAAPWKGRHIPTITAPRNGVLLFDAIVDDNGVARDGTYWTRFAEDLARNSDRIEDNAYIDYRYAGRCQLLFADSHVESLTPAQAAARFPDYQTYEGTR